jgi:ABC-type uncharacterized transport system permease subunit
MSDESLIDEVEAEVGTSRRKAVLAPFVALGVAIVMIGLVVLLIGAEPNDGNKTANTPLMDNPAPVNSAMARRSICPAAKEVGSYSTSSSLIAFHAVVSIPS